MWASPDIKTNPNHLPNSRGHGSSKYDNGSTWVDHSSGLGKASVNTVKKIRQQRVTITWSYFSAKN